MLTEHTVEKRFRKLFEIPGFDNDTLDKASDLLDQLRPESPLRHRLDQELEELREMVAVR